MRTTKLALFWYLGLLMGCGVLLVSVAQLVLHPEVLEGSSRVVVLSVPAPPAELDNTFHLELTVPPNAEVIVDGVRTTQRGPKREFVSPPLSPDESSTYKVAVRYT